MALTVHRTAYVRADGTPVRRTTFSIKNRGAPGRGKKLFTLRKGGLAGYSVKASTAERHRALKLISALNGALTVSRRVGALATLTKRTSPVMSARYRANQRWAKTL